jgi:hypothetical protein
LAPFGANSMQRQLSKCLCVNTGLTGRRENSGGRPPNIALARSLLGDAHRVALGSARPPRTPSDVTETKEEQQMGLEMLGFGDKSKHETNKDK